MEPVKIVETRQLGFAGLGAMGFGMVSNLLKRGFGVSGFDLNFATLDKLAKIGGKPCISSGEAAKDQQKFFIMVATPAQADMVIFGDNGVVQNLPEDAIICLFSTVPPLYITSLPKRLKAAGRPDLRLLDCPVSGGFVGAANGTLSIMMGGDSELIDLVRPELLAIAAPDRLLPTGPLGSASTLKMINQHLAGIHIVVAAETLAFAASQGLSTTQARDLLMRGAGASWILGDRGKTMLNADWAPKSAVDIFIKDLGIVCQTADDLQLPCPVASTAAQLFSERLSKGHGRDDDASVVCAYEDIMGRSVAEPQGPVSTATANGVVANTEALVLVTSENQTRAKLSGCPKLHTMAYADDTTLKQSLATFSPGTLVGVDKAEFLDLAADYLHLHFFDYKIMESVGGDSQGLLLFTNSHHDTQQSLDEALGPGHTAIPIIGASAQAMSQVIDLAKLLHAAAAVENFALASAAGVSLHLTYRLINGAAGSSAQFSEIYPKLLNKDFTVCPGVQSLEAAEASLRSIKTSMSAAKFPDRLFNVSYQLFKSAKQRTTAQGHSMAALINAWA